MNATVIEEEESYAKSITGNFEKTFCQDTYIATWNYWGQ